VVLDRINMVYKILRLWGKAKKTHRLRWG